MKLKRFSDFSDEKLEEKKVKEPEKEIELEEKTGDEPDDTDEEKEDDKTPVSKNAKTEKQEEKEDKEKVDENFEIEILEDHIIKFNEGHIKKIYELLNEKYSDTDYFLRKKDKQLHIVKYNENLKLNVNGFVGSLFKFYSMREDLAPLTKNIKIKGNDKFSVIENLNPKFIDKVAGDLTNLLSKKK